MTCAILRSRIASEVEFFRKLETPLFSKTGWTNDADVRPTFDKEPVRLQLSFQAPLHQPERPRTTAGYAKQTAMRPLDADLSFTHELNNAVPTPLPR